MTAWMVLMLAGLSAAADPQGESQRASAEASAPAVVANRPSDAAVSPSAAEGHSEDRLVERRGGRERARSGDAAASAGGRERDARSQGMLSMRELLPLLLVLALIGTLAWLARRYMPAGWRANLGGRGPVEVLARQHLSSRQSVALLRVGRRLVLVGVTPDRMTHLDTIADPDEVAMLVGRAASSRAGSLAGSFQSEVLREATAYEGTSATEEAAAGGSPGMYDSTRTQIRGLLTRVRGLAGSA